MTAANTVIRKNHADEANPAELVVAADRCPDLAAQVGRLGQDVRAGVAGGLRPG
jgi:hypothetical protein